MFGWLRKRRAPKLPLPEPVVLNIKAMSMQEYTKHRDGLLSLGSVDPGAEHVVYTPKVES